MGLNYNIDNGKYHAEDYLNYKYDYYLFIHSFEHSALFRLSRH